MQIAVHDQRGERERARAAAAAAAAAGLHSVLLLVRVARACGGGLHSVLLRVARASGGACASGGPLPALEPLLLFRGWCGQGAKRFSSTLDVQIGCSCLLGYIRPPAPPRALSTCWTP